jgi:hypothetical protein
VKESSNDKEKRKRKGLLLTVSVCKRHPDSFSIPIQGRKNFDIGIELHSMSSSTLDGKNISLFKNLKFQMCFNVNNIQNNYFIFHSRHKRLCCQCQPQGFPIKSFFSTKCVQQSIKNLLFMMLSDGEYNVEKETTNFLLRTHCCCDELLIVDDFFPLDADKIILSTFSWIKEMFDSFRFVNKTNRNCIKSILGAIAIIATLKQHQQCNLELFYLLPHMFNCLIRESVFHF